MADQSYDPTSSLDRGRLAHAIVRTLEGAGFELEDSRGGERVYRQQVSRRGKDGRELLPGVWVRVFTSIPSTGSLTVRETGKDAIRVCVVYLGGERSRGLGSETRVNRTGTIDAITGRMLERARSCWRAALERPRCRACGAITFISKKDRDVCAALCFKK